MADTLYQSFVHGLKESAERPVSKTPAKSGVRYNRDPAPLSADGVTGIGGQARQKKIMDTVDDMQ